jgi:hypothetical protein
MEEGEDLVHKGERSRRRERMVMYDDSGVILLIQALINAKIANKWVIKSHSHSDFAPNI